MRHKFTKFAFRERKKEHKKRELSYSEYSSDPKKNKAQGSTSSETNLDLSDLSDTSVPPPPFTMASEESSVSGTPHIVIPEMNKLSLMLRDTYKCEIGNLVHSVVKGVMKGLNARIDIMEKNITELHQKNTDLENQNTTLTARVVSLEKATDQAVQYSRRNNSRISGYDEAEHESTDDIVIKMASDIGSDLLLHEIDCSHRVGKPNLGRTKPKGILIKFTAYKARQKLYKKRTELKDKGYSGVFLNEDLTKLRSKVLLEARKVVKADSPKGVWSSDGNIFIKDYADVVHRLTSVDDRNGIVFPPKPPKPPAPAPMD